MFTNTAPNKPTGSATVHRTAQSGKLLVTFTVNATDPDGDAVSYEYSGHSADGYYAVGSHTVRVRAKDTWGLTSDWTDISFTVNNSAPTTPVITRTPSGNSVAPGVAITISITEKLTEREGEIAALLIKGKTYRMIAVELHVSENTVKTHVKNIYSKAGVQSRTELMNLLLDIHIPSTEADSSYK